MSYHSLSKSGDRQNKLKKNVKIANSKIISSNVPFVVTMVFTLKRRKVVNRKRRKRK